MHVGFTGTAKGMSGRQLEELKSLLSTLPGDAILHHGDCVGADAEAHLAARERGLSVVLHPPVDGKGRAFCSGWSSSLEPLPYLARNRAIVDSCDLLLAAPRTRQEELRSGTWATVRYARKAGKKVIILER